LSSRHLSSHPSSVNQPAAPAPETSATTATAPATTKRTQARATKESGPRIGNAGHIGGTFQLTEQPHFLLERDQIFQRFWQENENNLLNLPDQEISVTLPDGTVKTGIAFKTTPLDIALSISKGLADNVLIAKVQYTRRLESDSIVACDQDEEIPLSSSAGGNGELWDLSRPLVGDCQMKLFKFDDPEGKTVFWHSSAHVLGAALEATMGVHLTIGPALQVREGQARVRE
jgi:threonyl-tRNA synthetase